MKARPPWLGTALLGLSLLLAVAIGLLLTRSAGREPQRASEAPSPESPLAIDAATAIAPNVTLRVEVRTGTQIVSGARVSLQRQGFPEWGLRQQDTGPRGQAVFEALAPGEYGVRVEHSEFATHAQMLSLASGELTLEVLLDEGGSVVGRVLDVRLQPLAGANVYVFRGDSADLLRQTHTLADGSFALAGLPLEPVAVRVRVPPYRPESRALVFSRHGEQQTVQFRLVRGNVISGRVLSPEGEPIDGAHVGSTDLGGGFVTTDESGSFELGGLAHDPVALFATAQGFAPVQRRNVATGSRGLDLVLERPAVIRGQVILPSSAERLDVSVCRFDEAFQREICIARRSYRPPVTEYLLDQLPSGDYELVAEVAGQSTQRTRVRLEAGSSVQGPTLTWQAPSDP